MRILWVPHSSGIKGKRTPDRFFLEKLSALGHETHSVCWSVLPDHKLTTLFNPWYHLTSLKYSTYFEKGITFHHLPRIHNYWHMFWKNYGKVPLLNQIWFRSTIKEIIKDFDIEVVICSQSFDLIGFPPFDLKIPLVFHYVDYLDDKWEEIYCRSSDLVFCVSGVLFERAKRHNKNVFYLPNSVDIELLKNTDDNFVREKFNLKGCKLLSLIGIQAHTEFYWIDGINLASERIENLKCIFVGEDRMILPRIKSKINSLPERFKKNFIFAGAFESYDIIPSFFKATDVGIFPGHKDLPGDSICPTKVLEYTAARKPVVAPALEELKRWNFPNIVFVNETPESFAAGITYALGTSFIYPDLSDFDLNKNVDKLINILEGLITKK